MDYRVELQEYPLVRNLLGAVFNQDWRQDYDNVEEVYEDLLDGEPQQTRFARAEQIEAFVAARSDTDIDELVRASQSGINPTVDAEMSSRDWLLAVARRLRE